MKKQSVTTTVAMLYYSSPQIVLQEVPDEISLALAVSGCPVGCVGCHSTHTHSPTYGRPITLEALATLLRQNKHLSCVLFYGGEWAPDDLIPLLALVKNTGLKTCLYTGKELPDIQSQILLYLDYIKTGPYIEALGGLNSPTTNQRFIAL